MNNKTYNDGIINVYKEKNNLATTNFNEKKNTKTLDDMELVIPLAFKEMSKRQQDFDFANTLGHSLTMKVKTRLVDDVKNSHKVIYAGSIYDIIYLDADRINKELYIYMEEVRPINA